MAPFAQVLSLVERDSQSCSQKIPGSARSWLHWYLSWNKRRRFWTWGRRRWTNMECFRCHAGLFLGCPHQGYGWGYDVIQSLSSKSLHDVLSLCVVWNIVAKEWAAPLSSGQVEGGGAGKDFGIRHLDSHFLCGFQDEDVMFMVEAVKFCITKPMKTALFQDMLFCKAAKLVLTDLRELQTRHLSVRHASLQLSMTVKLQAAQVSQGLWRRCSWTNCAF